MNHENYIEGLTDELKAVSSVEETVIYNTFYPYIHNSKILKQVISSGILRYEYSKYIQDIKATRLEHDLKIIIQYLCPPPLLRMPMEWPIPVPNLPASISEEYPVAARPFPCRQASQ